MKVIAITGGIGSGKSVVCNILRANNFVVYDCDAEAKRLMDADVDIHYKLNTLIDPHVVVDGKIDRRLLADIVFNDTEKLSTLNSIVHGAVRQDIAKKIKSVSATHFFIETAILYQSGLDKIVDEVWEVTAPRDVRIARVMARNSCTAADVERRIESQDRFTPSSRHPHTVEIVNDGLVAVLPRVLSLL